MQNSKLIISAMVAGLAGAGLLAVLTFTTPSAQATPALAKGQPCTGCHAGAPPSSANLNDKGKKLQSTLKK